jgi:Spy/CpxP family protein refolding chaperone
MKKLFSAVMVVIFITLGFQSVSAQINKNKMKRGERNLKELNLTDSQKLKFKEIRFANEEANIDIEAKIKKNRLEMKKIRLSENIDEEVLMNLIDKGSLLKSELVKSKTRMWLNIRNILDDEQKKNWANHFNYKRERGERFFNGDRGMRGHGKDFRRGCEHEGNKKFDND